MKNMRLTLALACAAAAVLAAAPRAAAEDLTLVFKTTGKGAGTSTSYYSSEKMRAGDAENDMIVEYGPGKIVSVDHKKKEYSEITLAEMEAAMKQMAAKMEEAGKQMEQQMANLPPEMKKKMEQMMGGGASALTVTKGGTREIAGYSCQDYTLAMGETMTTKVCATTALAFPAPNVDFKRFASYAGAATAMANNPMFKGLSRLADEMKKIEGITIAESTSFKMMGKSMETSKEATEIKKGPIPASAFDVAAIAPGYKKVPHPVTKMK
jgi:hypothetical protein